MKVIVASTIEPFVNGGGTQIVDWLEKKLNEYGHEAQSLKIPYSMYYKEVIQQMIGLRLYHLEDYCDRLITIRTPSYLIPHPNKYLWFIHHYREMYDLWDTKYNNMPKNDEVRAVREYVMRADERAFEEAKAIYTNSQEISNRLKKYNDVDSEVVYPPVLDPDSFYCDTYGDFVYYSSRINGHKRQLLAVQAMKYVKSGVKLLVTGKCENDVTRKMIQREIRDNNLKNKVQIVDEWISEEQKIQYLSQCLAAIYIPFAEDSYGYPSLEAHHSRKSVITCKDSGGTDELIKDGYNGFIVEPDARALAEKFDMLYEDRKLAEKMGENGLRRIDELNINWDYVIGRFTQ